MIELVLWSFLVALLPIALSLGSRFLAVVAGPFIPPDDHPFALDRSVRPVPHFAIQPTSRSRIFGWVEPPQPHLPPRHGRFRI